MLLLLYSVTFILLTILAVACYLTGVDLSIFTRDPAAIMKTYPFVGLFSNIGILLWSGSAGICLFTARLLRYRKTSGEWPAFLFFSGLITIVLLVDDFFLLHEQVFPGYFGIREGLTFSVYGAAILLLIVKFRHLVRETGFIILFSALGFFALSLLVDNLFGGRLPWHYLFDDGFKLFGIVSWFYYFIATSFQAVADSGEVPAGGEK